MWFHCREKEKQKQNQNQNQNQNQTLPHQKQRKEEQNPQNHHHQKRRKEKENHQHHHHQKQRKEKENHQHHHHHDYLQLNQHLHFQRLLQKWITKISTCINIVWKCVFYNKFKNIAYVWLLTNRKNKRR